MIPERFKGLVFLLIIIVALIGLGLPHTTQTLGQILFQLGEGFVTLSLGQVDFVSNDPELAGQVWVLTVVQNGQGQYAVGTFSPDQIRDPVTGEKALYPLKIEMTVDEQKCTYPIINQYEPLYSSVQSEYRPLPFGIGLTEWKSECMSRPGYLGFGLQEGTWNYYCFWTGQPDAYYGTIGTPRLDFQSTIKLTSNGRVIDGTISNLGATSVDLDGVAKAYWAGNLVSGDQCPIPSSQDVAVVYIDGSWKIIDDSAYEDYRTYHEVGIHDCLDRFLHRTTELDECQNIYSSYYYSAIAQKQFISTAGSQAIATGTQNNGVVTIQLNKMIQYPVITMRIKAYWLGIYTPSCQPEIVSITSEPFRTGDIEGGFIVTTVRNIGDASCSFAVDVDCPPPFTAGATEFINLNPGEEGSVNTKIYVSTKQEVTGTCTVKVYDRNNPSKYDTGTVTVKGLPIVVCTPGAKKCVGDAIQMCDETGTGWITIKTCEYGCVIKDGVPVCREQQECLADSDGDGIRDCYDRCPYQYGVPEYSGTPY